MTEALAVANTAKESASDSYESVSNLEKEPTMYEYPFPSETANQTKAAREAGAKIEDWQAPGVDIGETLKNIHGSILEIGGPTDSGFYFLDGRKLPD